MPKRRRVVPFKRPRSVHCRRLPQRHRDAENYFFKSYALSKEASVSLCLCGLFNLDSPPRADLERRHVRTAAADPEFREKSILVAEAEEITAARVQIAAGFRCVTELHDDDRWSAALDQRPPGLTERKLHDQIEIERPQPQAVAETAVEAGP